MSLENLDDGPVHMHKGRADGLCNWCGEVVPKGKLNLFYCSEACRMRGWDYNHPPEEEPWE